MEPPRIEFAEELKLLGQKVRMSFAKNKTQDLFKGFMPRKKEIKNKVGSAVYSVEIYDDLPFFESFDPSTEFEKWAAVEVSDYFNVPSKMHLLVIRSGEYTVYNYKGNGSDISKIYEYILSV